MLRLFCAGLIVLTTLPALAQTGATTPAAPAAPAVIPSTSAAAPAATPLAAPKATGVAEAPLPPATPISTGDGPPALSDETSIGSTMPIGTAMPSEAELAKYLNPSWNSLIATLVAFKAIDYKNDPQILDDYAIATQCEAYLAYHEDEFKWREARKSLIEAMSREAAKNPTYYHYDVALQLGQYDFDNQIFKFAAHSGVSNVNAFLMSRNDTPECGRHKSMLPTKFRAVLSIPVSIRGLPMPPAQGEAVLNEMNDKKNKDRVIYARFNFHVIYIEHIIKTTKLRGDVERTSYTQGGNDASTVQLGVELDNAQFYMDEKHTEQLYAFKP